MLFASPFLALALMVALTANASAYVIDHRWPDGKENFYVCINGTGTDGFSDDKRQKVLGWMQRWENVPGVYLGIWQIGLGDSDCSDFWAYDIIVTKDETPNNVPAATDVNLSVFGTIIGAEIIIDRSTMNGDYFWWGQTRRHAWSADPVTWMLRPSSCMKPVTPLDSATPTIRTNVASSEAHPTK
jgi:hypothetical protein